MPDIWNTNLRLNLEKENHKKAYEYLCAMDRKKFKSYNQVIADALVEYFERYYKQEDDPYFETREKEDQFMNRIVHSVERQLARTLPVYLAGCVAGSSSAARQNAEKERD